MSWAILPRWLWKLEDLNTWDFVLQDHKEVQELSHTVENFFILGSPPNLVIWEKAANLKLVSTGHQQYFHFPSDIANPILSHPFPKNPFPTGTGHTYRKLGLWLGILHGGYSRWSQLKKRPVDSVNPKRGCQQKNDCVEKKPMSSLWVEVSLESSWNGVSIFVKQLSLRLWVNYEGLILEK